MRRHLSALLLTTVAVLSVGCIDLSFSQPETRGMKQEQSRETKANLPAESIKSLEVPSESSKWPTDRTGAGGNTGSSQVDSVFPRGIAPTGAAPKTLDKGLAGPRS